MTCQWALRCNRCRVAGFVPSPLWSPPPYLQTVASSLEFAYLPLTDVVNSSAEPAAIDAGLGRSVEPLLAAAASRGTHLVGRCCWRTVLPCAGAVRAFGG